MLERTHEVLLVAVVMLALGACDEGPANVGSAQNDPVVGVGEAKSRAANAASITRVPAPEMAANSADARDQPTSMPGAVVVSIPQAVRGKWRRSAGADVTAVQCDDANYANAGEILTITADRFVRFEDGGRLVRVIESDGSRIVGTFDTTYADKRTQGDFIFDAQDDGQTLIERQYGAGAQPGPIQYRRCASGRR